MSRFGARVYELGNLFVIKGKRRYYSVLRINRVLWRLGGILGAFECQPGCVLGFPHTCLECKKEE